MTIEYAVVAAGAFLVLVAVLIWKLIDKRLSEIQAELSDLQTGVSRLFVMALNAKSEAASKDGPKTFKAEPNIESADGGEVATKDHEHSPTPLGLEAELSEVDELCAKLITLVPPAKAVPLLSGEKAETPVKFEGRRRLSWPPQKSSP